jgi:hydrogenase maturation factor
VAAEATGLGTGKLSPELLRGLVLGQLGARRPETLVPAALGIDAAVIAIDGDWACVLTCDPITTASSGAGRLAVHVVCNDLAAMGAEPVGVLATLLFPAGTSAATVGALMAEIDATARLLNVEVLGGHTEIAPGVSAPLVVMSGVGRAPRDHVLTAGGGRPGEALVLTKAAALEGTHVLAGDVADTLRGAGVAQDVLDEAVRYGDELSVVREARLAAELGATAMHDPTEGGVVGAVWEMAEASGCGFAVQVGSIPVRAATLTICAALGVDPLRLIASGALLIACHDGGAMVLGLAERNIPAAQIGELTPLDHGRVLIHPDGRAETVSSVGRDELYRLLSETEGTPLGRMR